ncbi:MAG: LysM peptidoglycan-binding domain-containing protein [Methylocystis sp.]
MISLSSPYLTLILIAALAAALIFHLSRMLGRQRWVHAAYAAAALGLIFLMGAAAFGWAFPGEGALLWVYLALFILAAAVAARRRLRLGAIGLPWLSALIQLGVVAYMFAPEPFRKPPVTAALFLYFLFEAAVWLRGREDEPAPGDDDDKKRPPLFPPPRRRGVAEVSLAVAGIAIAYLLFVGPRPADVGPDSATAQQHETQIEEAAATGETAASEETPAQPAAPDDAANSGGAASEQPEAAPQVATSEPSPPLAPAGAKDPGVYAARAGDTFKSIAKRLYGTANKWRALADANPELKAKRFRAGQLIKLPSAPTP